MGLLRRREPDDAEEEEDSSGPGVYRVEVDGEKHHFRNEIPFSFWSSAKIILLLAILLWWLPQSAGFMVAGYVGGRRAGAPWKAVLAALIPVILIYGATSSYDVGYGESQIEFLAGLPSAIAAVIGNAVPFLAPYGVFVVDYLTTFVLALQTVFGMGSNGYLVTVAFAYIGGIVAEQTRREITAKEGASTTVQIVQPVLRRVHREPELVRAHPRARAHRGRGRPSSFSEFRKIPAEFDVRRPAIIVRRRRPDPDEVERPRPAEASPPEHDRRDRSVATQKFVERALRHYERTQRSHHHRD